MTFRLLFFGALSEAVGSRQLNISMPGPVSCESLVSEITRKHPLLETYKLLIAINEEYAGADTMVNDGDEVAIFTAVSGG